MFVVSFTVLCGSVSSDTRNLRVTADSSDQLLQTFQNKTCFIINVIIVIVAVSVILCIMFVGWLWSFELIAYVIYVVKWVEENNEREEKFQFQIQKG